MLPSVYLFSFMLQSDTSNMIVVFVVRHKHTFDATVQLVRPLARLQRDRLRGCSQSSIYLEKFLYIICNRWNNVLV